MTRCRKSRRWSSQRGQAYLIIIVLVAVVLAGLLGFATDYSQIWAHRQMAQAAADSACQAGAADLYLQFQSPTLTGVDFSWIGSPFTCDAHPTSAVCQYAVKNGYSGTQVSVDFPSSLPGAPNLANFGTIAHPYIKVTINDDVPLSLVKLLTSGSTFPMKASAGCGLAPVAVAIPLVVLHKTMSGAFLINGTPDVKVYGGPNRSIQVDSNSATAFAPGGNSSLVDLTKAGPATSGADFGVFGGPTTKPATVSLGTGSWISGALPYGDPWANIAAPTQPAAAGAATQVGLGVHGCPDPNGCVEFSPGDYTGCINSGNIAANAKGCLVLPTKYGFNYGTRTNANNGAAFSAGTTIRNGSYLFRATTGGVAGSSVPVWPSTGGTVNDGSVVWTNMGWVDSNANKSGLTAIFDPGVYYVGAEGLQLTSNSTVRPSTATGDSSGGTTFYFSAATGGSTTPATIAVDSNAGKSAACTSASEGSGSPNGCIVSYHPDGSTVLGYVTSLGLDCPVNGGGYPTSVVPTSIDGNILLGPCSGGYTATSKDGKAYRGFLFFQNRANAVNATWNGGGQFLLSGFMYFHNTSYATTLSLSGNSGAGAYALGNIVTDQLTLGGTSGMDMILNPATSYQILKPQLLQ